MHMTFLNPLVLFGLLAAAIPLILHLLNLRKLKTIEFSTLAFLKELQQTKIRRFKLKQWLLLVIRTLIIIFIVLAFSRPAVRGTVLGGIGSHAHSTIILILDDSFSMSVQDEQGEFFKQAKETALKIINLLKDGDEVLLIKLSNVESQEQIPSHDFDIVRTTINESKISEIRNGLEPALRIASKLISQSKNANKEVYLVSDFQKTLIEKIKKDLAPNSKTLFEEGVNFFIINIGSKEISNAAVDTISVETKLFEKNKPVVIKSVIKNYGKLALKNFIVSLYLNGIRVAQRSVDINSWSEATVEFSAIVKRTGFIKGYVELENDNLEQDNRRYFTIYVHENLKTMIVSASTDDSRFIKLALTAATVDNKQSFFRITEVKPALVSTVDFKNNDVLVIQSFGNLNDSQVNQIKLFLERGGGLVIFPESNFRFEELNRFLSQINIPEVEGLIKVSGQTEIYLKNIDFDHPVFYGVFEEGKKGIGKRLESPNIFLAIKQRPGKTGHPIITLSDGNPFLTEYKIVGGTVLFYSVSPTLSWSDFPLKSMFAPLIYRSISYAAFGQQSPFSTLVNRSITVKLKTNLTGQVKYKLISPDGVEQYLPSLAETKPGISRGFVSLSKLTQSGIYELAYGADQCVMIAVNIDSKESDLRKADNENLSEFFDGFNINGKYIKYLDAGEEIQEEILTSRFGLELWKYAIAFVILLALVEMFVARESRKNQPR
ncbi:MAG: BatA domain-containing protein [Bacteroidota bacterium]|nr:BatA domain-containing protein [Bacteroidota bacterium]